MLARAKYENNSGLKSASYGRANDLFDGSVRLIKGSTTYYMWVASLYAEGDCSRAWKMVKIARAMGGEDPIEFIKKLSENMVEPL